MNGNNEIKVGDTVLLKVGRNEAKVKILKPMAGGNAFMVKSLSSGKEFIAPSNRLNVQTVSIERIEPKPETVAAASVPVAPEDAPTPRPRAPRPRRCR